ncbi:hypothetical protein AURDEDRAFT_111624 [Auricularia subglabra TFB-10046 SS5]|nr:hypothetical protein AURDEDRAFT_111624 [Auricularia subglabra TFB-10046 SS5]
MKLSAFVALAVAAFSSAAPSTTQRDDPKFPSKASVWVQTQWGLTLAFLTTDGKAWQWADESGDSPVPVVQFVTHLVPITVRPGNLITSLELDGKTCKYIDTVFDCSAAAAANASLPTAFFQAVYATDPVGDQGWKLLGPKQTFTLWNYDEELKQLSSSPSLGYSLWLADVD